MNNHINALKTKCDPGSPRRTVAKGVTGAGERYGLDGKLGLPGLLKTEENLKKIEVLEFRDCLETRLPRKGRNPEDFKVTKDNRGNKGIW